MKINSLQRDMALKQGRFSIPENPQSFKQKSGAGVRGQNLGLNTDNSGNLTNESEVAAINFRGNLGSKIGKSDWFNWVLEKTAKHNVAASAFVGLILAGVLRPMAIMSLPGKKDKDDKIYASGQAVASGVIGFAFSTLITTPLDDAIDKVKKNPSKFTATKLAKLKELSKTADSELKRNIAKRTVESLETCLKNIPDWIIAVPRSILTIALIPPILKYVFGMEKKKKNPEKTVEQPKMENMNNLKTAYNISMNPSMEAFTKGGLK